jgi:redox-sensitive bicupin YhaK (pirin superfamily)
MVHACNAERNQWMTAASGIVHEEFHSARFTREGGTLEMAQLRVNCRCLRRTSGPARTFSPMDVWNVRLRAGRSATLDLPTDRTAAVIVLRGSVTLAGADPMRDGELALIDRGEGGVTLAAGEDSTLLVLSGEPIDEPVVAYGPFVTNTVEEIQEAKRDFARGRFGRIGP